MLSPRRPRRRERRTLDKVFSQVSIFNTIMSRAITLAHIHHLAVYINNHTQMCDPNMTIDQLFRLNYLAIFLGYGF